MTTPNSSLYEVEFLEGLHACVTHEMTHRYPHHVEIVAAHTNRLICCFQGDTGWVDELRTVVAVYRIDHYAIPRPKALLGHQHLTHLLEIIQMVQKRSPPQTFQSFRFSAAGKNSTVFQRLRDEIAQVTGLVHDPGGADLLLRIRPAQAQPDGWEVLTRLTPRPLATRAWRVCDRPGALNATIAACMVDMTNPQQNDVFLNLMSGTGTLLIERALHAAAQAIIGIERDADMLSCAQQNIEAAGVADAVTLKQGDVTTLDIATRSVDSVAVDLPWGQYVGDHDENASLYPATLQEAARVSKPGARLVALTHEVRLMEQVIEQVELWWTLRGTSKIFQGGLHPRVYTFERTDAQSSTYENG